MIELTTLVSYVNAELEVHRYKDYCPNGLQVEGRAQVGRLVTGVSASQRLLEAAVDAGADAVLVHHGYFWRGEDPRVIGQKYRRLKILLQNNISLLAYHLPLDQHETLGNNVQLARHLGWQIDPASRVDGRPPLLRTTHLDTPVSGAQLAAHIQKSLAREPMHIPADRPIKRIAWCTGAAQSYINDAVDLGVDAYISGEISEQTVHEAHESGIHFFAAGHHATERYGVEALGAAIAAKYTIDCEFIDCPNPV